MDLEPNGYIRDVRNLILNGVPTSAKWAELQGIQLISSIMGTDRYLMTAQGKLQLNVSVTGIGPSGLAGKSQPLLKYTVPILERVSEELEKNYLFPSRFTVEGMIKHFTGDDAEYGTEGIIIRDEFSALLKEARSKDYGSDMLEFLSEIYDGYIAGRTTIKHGYQKPAHICIGFMASSTPYFFERLKKGFFIQGLGNRQVWPLLKPEDQFDVSPQDFLIAPSQNYHSVNGALDALAERLATIQRNCPEYFNFEPRAASRLTKYRNDEKTRASTRYSKGNVNDLLYSYIDRNGEKALKLAAIHAVSSQEVGIGQGLLEEIIIRDSDALWAIERTHKYYRDFLDILNVWDEVSKKVKPIASLDMHVDKVIRIMTKWNTDLSITKLKNGTKFTRVEFMETINYMLEMKLLYAYKKKNNKRGPETQYYSLTPKN